MTDTSYRRPTVETGVKYARAYARRANSEDSIEVLSTTESIFPDDLTAITEEEAEHQPLSNGFKNVQDTLTECNSDDVLREVKALNANVNEHENEGPVQEDEGGVDREKSLKHTGASGGVVIPAEQVTECVKSNQVHEDRSPEKTSKLLQGNT